MKTMTLTLLVALALVGCSDGDTAFQSTSEPSSSGSTASRWLRTCVFELARNQPSEVRWFNGIGANDVEFIPGNNVVEDILERCQSMCPLADADIAFCRSWLKERICEILAITPGTPRAQVDESLLENGGISTPAAAIYSHRDCIVLKVRVEFDKNNKVKAMSTPYLGLFIAD